MKTTGSLSPAQALARLCAWPVWYIGNNPDNFVTKNTIDGKPCVCIFQTQIGAMDALAKAKMPNGSVLVIDKPKYGEMLYAFAKDGFGLMFQLNGEWMCVFTGPPIRVSNEVSP